MDSESGSDTEKNAGDVFVVFTPTGRRGRFPVGTPVLTAARQLGVDLDSVCGGRAICGRCQVTHAVGDFAKFQIESAAANLSEPSPAETRYADKRGLKAGRRLGCNARLLGDCVIDIPAESQVHKQIVRKRAEVRQIDVRPVTKLHYVDVREPDMHEPSGDLRRLEEALRGQWPDAVADRPLIIDPTVLPGLQTALRKGKWSVTVALREGHEITAVWPGFKERIVGLAVDIGSTTIAGHLCDLATGEVLASSGAMNPQIRFGEDLMSRVSYVMMNPGGDREMTAVVRDAVTMIAGQTVREAGLEASDILEVVVVGNPVMHHLFLGLDPVELGGAPFALALDTAITLPARDLDLAVHAGARVYVLPCIAGHVGADTAGVILAEGPHRQDALTLVVDVGTNAEIVLGDGKRVLACSSPTGPAFEGAQISSGQRAAPGAIERVRIDPETLEPRFKVIGSDLWSDEDGFAAETRKTGITGICGSGIIEVLAEMFLAGILTTDGIVDGTLATKSERVVPDGRTFAYKLADGVTITQGDVRAIQLAKAALYAGFRLLMDERGVDRVERVILAGAFGSHIDTKHAMILGMLPDCDLSKVWSAGNAAGTGARIALLDREARAEIERVVRDVEKIETAVEPKFQEHFVAAMAIPHKTDRYETLRAAVPMPEPTEASTAPADGGGRRRRRRG